MSRPNVQLHSKRITLTNKERTHCADRTGGGCRREKNTSPHFCANARCKPPGASGGICGEGMARTDPSFPHHACDSALFTLSWRVAPFDQAGEARGWVVVLTKSQCAVCRQGNFPGWLCVLTCVDWGVGRVGRGTRSAPEPMEGPKIKQISADFLAPSLVSGVSAPPMYIFFLHCTFCVFTLLLISSLHMIPYVFCN